MARKIAEPLIDTLAEVGAERIYAVTGDSLHEVNEVVRKSDKSSPRRNRSLCRSSRSATDRTAGMLCGKQRTDTDNKGEVNKRQYD